MKSRSADHCDKGHQRRRSRGRVSADTPDRGIDRFPEAVRPVPDWLQMLVSGSDLKIDQQAHDDNGIMIKNGHVQV